MNRILTRTRRQPTHRRAHAGIPLVETTVVTSVLAVLTGLAAHRTNAVAPPMEPPSARAMPRPNVRSDSSPAARSA